MLYQARHLRRRDGMMYFKFMPTQTVFADFMVDASYIFILQLRKYFTYILSKKYL